MIKNEYKKELVKLQIKAAVECLRHQREREKQAALAFGPTKEIHKLGVIFWAAQKDNYIFQARLAAL
jgi:hypothetical protein